MSLLRSGEPAAAVEPITWLPLPAAVVVAARMQPVLSLQLQMRF